MMTTWYSILGVLVYFQGTTSSLVQGNWQNIASCKGQQCQQYQLAYHQPISQYVTNLDNQVSSSNYHPIIQNIPLTYYYQTPVQHQGIPCPFGHGLNAQQLDHQQKILESTHYQQSQGYQHQAISEEFKRYQSSQKQLNNAYLPPDNHLQVGSVDIQRSHISSESHQQSNNNHLQVINQNQYSTNFGVQHHPVNLQSNQQLNTNYLQLLNQNQHIANVGIQQNQHASSEASHHQGKIKQTVRYDINHVHQHSQNRNVYSDAKSSTNIEQHHDLNHHSEGSEESHEIDVLTGKKKKDHDAYYKFEYAVNDQHTGDIKNHKEERSGDEVTGEYSLVEDDGNVRTVKYFADWKTGFHATVHNSKPRA
ncbi:hypothetical protein WA026_006843 [Henosepilachna vigintioctopunctata]|uniref:Uncharacterized protein n=1 Tax=Henosepilachna vigintioctopunctata TaxID=420089 RepID=A0AAW1UFG5_9CUCU